MKEKGYPFSRSHLIGKLLCQGLLPAQTAKRAHKKLPSEKRAKVENRVRTVREIR